MADALGLSSILQNTAGSQSRLIKIESFNLKVKKEYDDTPYEEIIAASTKTFQLSESFNIACIQVNYLHSVNSQQSSICDISFPKEFIVCPNYGDLIIVGAQTPKVSTGSTQSTTSLYNYITSTLKITGSATNCSLQILGDINTSIDGIIAFFAI